MPTGNELVNFEMAKYMHDKLEGEIAAVAGIAGVDSWQDVQTIVRQGLASKVFSIGDQLTCQRDGVNLVWDIIGIDHDSPADPQYTHSMTLQLHDCFPTFMQFDAPEAFYYAEAGLAAGTYYFTIDSSYETTYNSFKDTGYQFTLTQAVPAKGQLTFPWGYQTQTSGVNVSSYADSASSTAIESVAVSSGTSGTFLGNLTSTGDFNNLNGVERIRYGSNNYKESAMRQWLNSDKTAGSVWTSQTKFDRPPSWASSTAGFINGLDEDFLAATGKTHLVVSRNIITDNGGKDELDDKFFLLSKREVYAGNESSSTIEGEPYPYFSDYSDLSTPGYGDDSNRIKKLNGNPVRWWLRSPCTGYSYNTRVVYRTGAVYDNGAAGSCGVVVACNII